MTYAEALAKDRDALRRACGSLIAALEMASERLALNNCQREEDANIAKIEKTLIAARKTIEGKFTLNRPQRQLRPV